MRDACASDERLSHGIFTALSHLMHSLLTVTQVLVMISFPLFSYAGVIGTASGMVDLKDMKPLLNRLRPSSRRMMVSTPKNSLMNRKDSTAVTVAVDPVACYFVSVMCLM